MTYGPASSQLRRMGLETCGTAARLACVLVPRVDPATLGPALAALAQAYGSTAPGPDAPYS